MKNLLFLIALVFGMNMTAQSTIHSNHQDYFVDDVSVDQEIHEYTFDLNNKSKIITQHQVDGEFIHYKILGQDMIDTDMGTILVFNCTNLNINEPAIIRVCMVDPKDDSSVYAVVLSFILNDQAAIDVIYSYKQ